MIRIRQEVLDYLASQNVGVLAVEMLDGSPHGATVHFAHAEDPFTLYFETCRDYRKAEPILAKESVRASFVVGVTESDPRTLQLDGIIELVPADDETVFEEIYLGKFPNKREKLQDSKYIHLRFTPTWWRFSDFTAPGGKLILNSE